MNDCRATTTTKAGSLLASLLASWLTIGGFLLGIDSIESIESIHGQQKHEARCK
jgi:hypothetical protein